MKSKKVKKISEKGLAKATALTRPKFVVIEKAAEIHH